ncbi:MAG TPA: hypothetical protein VJ506_04840 [Candidatus Limnocylindrales bacterium]|nr:hypothetical protein [Candidatus Limnocylindrales bacterium]
MTDHPAAPAPGAAPSRPAAPRPRLSAPRIPAHIGVLLGASTAAYAVTLAGITGLQATSEADLAAERAPAVAGVQDLGAKNQELGNALAAAGLHYDSLTRAYAAAGGRLADLEAALADLVTSVQAIDGVSRSMPASIPLPKVSRVSVGGAPATSSTTGASGVP